MTTPTVRIADLGRHVGEVVRLDGWLYNKRLTKNLQFLLVRDGSGIAQGVVVKAEAVSVAEAGERVTQESSLSVEGVVRAEPKAPGGYELTLSAVQVHQVADAYPIAKQEHGPDFLLSNRHLWLRSRKQVAVMKVRHTVVKAIRDFFDSRDFTLIDAPIFTPAACEGTTTLFETQYFDDEKAYLSQSGQLYMEAAAMAHGKVYCFGPTFRAEKSKTRRHLTEFWMVEPEMSYATLDDVMDLAEGLVSSIVQRCLEKHPEDFKVLERDPKPLDKVTAPFPRLSYTEAVEKLQGTEAQMPWGGDFGAPQETALSALYDRPVMVHRYPAQVKAFYMKADPADGRLALSVDVLAPEGVGEIIGGGQRADDLAYLEGKIAEHKLPKAAFAWYLDLRRYGSVPHGGFGLGVERTTAWICGREHVRECIPFPRMMYRIYP
jgi:asparaginyl-tRNA synthetase